MEAWVTTIDPEQRWTPVEGDKASLPQAFQGDDFVALFGKPAMDWTADDAEAVAAAVYECGQTAGREGRREIRQALYSARGIFLRDLRHALRTAEQVEQAKQREAERAAEARRRQEARAAQAQADLEQALDRLMAESDSPDLLHDLGVLTAMGPQAGTAQRPAEPLRLDSARRFARILQRMEKGTGDPAVGPQLDARFKSAHEAMMKEQRAMIEGMNESTNSVRALYQIIPTLEQELGLALTDADKEALGEAVVKKAESIREAIVARGKKLIDDAGDGTSGIQSIEKIVGQIAGAGLRPPQAAELKTYARTRLQSLADGVLVEAETSLDTIPDTLAGMQAVVDLV
ncbi:MAG: hypothetical protein CMM50_04305, partial [Rhodospirillaceae bacterium]|nr:hypothetical protein [Rhodospirillaceae bacterium]